MSLLCEQYKAEAPETCAPVGKKGKQWHYERKGSQTNILRRLGSFTEDDGNKVVECEQARAL